jgi:hypothetical protein
LFIKAKLRKDLLTNSFTVVKDIRGIGSWILVPKLPEGDDVVEGKYLFDTL